MKKTCWNCKYFIKWTDDEWCVRKDIYEYTTTDNMCYHWRQDEGLDTHILVLENNERIYKERI